MRFSLANILVVIFVGYVLNSVWTIYQLFVPPTCTTKSGCIHPLLKNKPKLQLALFTSTKQKLYSDSALTSLWQWDDFDYSKQLNVTVNVTLPHVTRNNGSLFLHAFLVTKFSGQNMPVSQLISSPYASYAAAPLTIYMIPEPETFILLGSTKKSEDKQSLRKDEKAVPVTHWRNKLAVGVMSELVSFPNKQVPRELASFISLTPSNEYLPILNIDTLQTRIRDLKPITKEQTQVELNICSAPISFGRLRLQIQLEGALQTMNSLGFTDKDVDEVKSVFMDTNLYLLCITFIVAVFHLLFDFLAFKNDIAFWRKKKSMVGMSTTTVIWRCCSQMIIFLYLLDEETSLLVLVPTGIASVIEMWKMTKLFRVTIHFSGRMPTLKLGSPSEEELKTEQYDAQSMRYLSYLLYPLCIAGAVYSLIYTPHRSWYSWCIHSLVNGVYAFGFLFMLPQLFVNYKHKSVAHLPWKAFMYKAFNTFIDDVFAFIITMPTAHRVACFRDDFVFLIYLYQRWLYPVDKSRVNEFGESFDDQSQIKKQN